jgi:hypothetical protein
MKNIIDSWNDYMQNSVIAMRAESSRKEADKVDGRAQHTAEFSNFSRCVWKLESEA